MRVSSTTYGSRGNVEPMVGLAVHRGALGGEARVGTPSDFAELPGGVGVRPVPIGPPVCPPVCLPASAVTPTGGGRL